MATSVPCSGTCTQLGVGFLVAIFVCSAKAGAVPRSGHWKRTMTSDIEAGNSLSREAAPTLLACTALCGQQDGCLSFGFQPHRGTCLLYDRLVEHTTVGTAAPGTRYYWLLSQRCPTELGYTLEAGICYKVFQEVWTSWDNAADLCRQDGGLLLVADSQAIMDHVIALGQTSLWLGATDRGQEGDWRWLNGRAVGSYAWAPNQPDDVDNADCGYLNPDLQLDDSPCHQSKQPLCQVLSDSRTQP